MTGTKQVIIKGFARNGAETRILLSNGKDKEIKIMLEDKEIHIGTMKLVKALTILIDLPKGGSEV